MNKGALVLQALSINKEPRYKLDVVTYQWMIFLESVGATRFEPASLIQS
jgi:hypothetical protein